MKLRYLLSISFIALSFYLPHSHSETSLSSIVKEKKNQPLSYTPRQYSAEELEILVGSLESLKAEYIDLLTRAEVALEDQLREASEYTKRWAKDYYFERGMIGLLILNARLDIRPSLYQAARIDHLIRLIQKNTGSSRDLAEAEMRLTSIEARKDFAFAQLQSIVDGTAKVPMYWFPIAYENCGNWDGKRTLNGWIYFYPTNSRAYQYPFNTKIGVKLLTEIVNMATVPLNPSTIEFFNNNQKLTIKCQEAGFWSFSEMELSVDYDRSSNTITLSGDGERFPEAQEVINLVRAQIGNE